MKRIRPMTYGLLAAALTCTTLLSPARAALPAALSAALDQAPDGAQVVIVVPDMASFSDKIASLKQDLGLPFGDMDDALGNFKRETGMIEGVNDAGAAVFALTNVDEAAQNDTPPNITMLVPVSDYDAFVQQFGGTGGGAVTAVTMPSGQAGFACKSGDHAVLCETEAAAAAYKPGGASAAIAQQVGTLGEKYLADADLALYVDAATVGPALTPMLEGGIAEMQAEIGQQAGAAQQQFLALYAEAFKAVLEDTDALVGALSLGDAGVAMTWALQYKAGSELAEVLPGGSSNASKLLATMPDEPFLMAVSMDLKALNLTQVLDNLFEAMPDAEQNPMLAIYKDAIPLAKQTSGSASVFYAPDEMAMMTGNFFNALTVYEVDDGPAYIEATKTYFEKLNGLSIPIGEPGVEASGEAPDQAPPAITYLASYTENALEIDGVRVDQYQLSMNMPPEVMAEMAQAGPWAAMMMGGMNYQGYMAAKGNHVIGTTVLDPQVVTKALAAVDKDTGIGAAGPIAEVRDDALPPGCMLEGYLSIDGLAQTANNFVIPMFGMQPIQVPADLPPLCLAVGIEGNGLAKRIYLPNASLKFIAETIMNIQSNVQQGGPGGPDGYPGGTQPPPFN